MVFGVQRDVAEAHEAETNSIQAHATPTSNHALSASASSSSSTRKASLASTASSSSHRAAQRARPVTVSDDDLASIATSSKNATLWEQILLSARAGPGRWKLQHNAGDFAVYMRQESNRYGVLAVGLVLGQPGEVMNVLQCQSSAQYVQQMEAAFGDQVTDGSFVYHVPHPQQATADKQVQLTDLSVKTVTFHKSGWMGTHEEWCYLDAVYRHGSTGAAEKLMTTLQPTAILAGLSPSRTKYLHDVTCAYLLLPEDHARDEQNQSEDHEPTKKRAKSTAACTRVYFYGEFLVPKQVLLPSLGLGVSEKAIKQRLLKLADSSARLSDLVRRQRLGVQGIVDYTRFLPPTNTPCMVCTKMLLVAKVCRLCGMGVCTDCSTKKERATQPTTGGRIHVTSIRVCADCMHRVDRADYSNLTPSSLQGPHIVPDPEDAPAAETVLRQLLHDALVAAPSPTRKAGVMSVIKCVLDQAEESRSSVRSSSSRPSSSVSPCSVSLLTPTSSEREYLDALDLLEVAPFPGGDTPQQSPVRPHNDRCYQMDATHADAPLNAPLAACEDARARAVEQQIDMDRLCESSELTILCHLAAAEMRCSTSTISIFDRESLHCVAANIPAYARLTLPRGNTLCAHTILDARPHLIPHPEADMRMADALVVTGFGVRFYLAFPILDPRGQHIVGSFCVMDEMSQEITQAQFSGFQKLAETCNKVVRVHADKTTKPHKSSHAGNRWYTVSQG